MFRKLHVVEKKKNYFRILKRDDRGPIENTVKFT